MTIQHMQSVIDVPPIAADGVAPLLSFPVGENFRWTPTGLQVVGEPTFEACAAFGELLRTAEVSLQFVVGDYCRYIEDRFGEQASQILDATGWSERTLNVYRWVAEKVAPEDRMIDKGLSFKHHQIVAALDPETQRKWLEKARPSEEQAAWPVRRLDAAIKSSGDVAARFGFYVSCDSQEDVERLKALVVSAGGRA